MNKKLIVGLIVVLAVVITAIGLFYVFYIADYTYEDERISIVVPQGTEFNVKAVDMEGNFDTITYNDTSEKNIVVTIMRVAEGSILGMSIKDFLLNTLEKQVEEEGFTPVEITANYTIYKSNETGRYNVLIKNPEGFNGFVIIGCIGELEDIKRLVESFKFKSYTTEGLAIETQSNMNDSSSTNMNTVNSKGTQTPTEKTYSSKEEAVRETGRGDISPEQEAKLYEDGKDYYYDGRWYNFDDYLDAVYG